MNLDQFTPLTTHRLVDETVGCIVVDECLCLWIEVECTIQAQGANTHVDDGCTAMAVALVEGKLTAIANTLEEVCVSLFGVGQLVDDLLYVWNGAFESLVYLSVWAFDVRHLTLAFISFTFEDDLASIGIGVGNATPNTHCVGVLLWSIYLYLYGEIIVFA